MAEKSKDMIEAEKRIAYLLAEQCEELGSKWESLVLEGLDLTN
jgi:hypothetical protein